jgi:hypothetical protein
MYMFYDDNNLTSKSMTPLNSIKSLSPSTSFVNSTKLSSAIRNIILDGLGLSADISLQNAGNYIKENAR